MSGQTAPPTSVVLVELFTSEGCSSCPPADRLLSEINGRQTAAGQLIVGISEHVTYWNRLGWTDPFSSESYTQRQVEYNNRFQSDGPYTPQMVVNGHEQFVGGNRNELLLALSKESAYKQIHLHITNAVLNGKEISFEYLAENVPQEAKPELTAVIVDDNDHSDVKRGENSGRQLQHVFVARAIVPVGKLSAGAAKKITIPLPPGFAPSQPHHLVLFAQEKGLGQVLGVDLMALEPAPH